MSIAPEALLEQALSLPPADRAKLASGLLASLDDDETDEAAVEQFSSEETERRTMGIASGDAPLTTWEQVTARVDELRPSPSAD